MTPPSPVDTQAPRRPAPKAASGDASGTVIPAREPRSTREEHLRRTAHDLFSKAGLGVPLAEIAKAAGMGVATLYRRYRDKDILILDVYREHMADGERFALTANSFDNPWEGIEYFLRSSTDQLMSDRGMRELVLGGYIGGAGWARSSTHEELIRALDAMEVTVTSQLEVLVRRAKAAKVVRPDFRHTDLRLMTAMAHAVLPVGATGKTEMGRRALQLLIEGIRPPVPLP
ncbi:TetR/AcrR family transcriptional regulator [Specibacter sp. RAF43]|uniref:TetR/AcrR family transcriptional regulator n=1 Tax=Specibacter sp. RAF43 TaxID=3233057 RepID=UPI003F99C80F